MLPNHLTESCSGKMHVLLPLVFFICYCSLSAQSVVADDSAKKTPLWFRFGIASMKGIEPLYGIDLGFTVNFMEGHAVSVRVMQGQALPSSNLRLPGRPADNILDASLLYGIITRDEIGQAALFAGVGIAHGQVLKTTRAVQTFSNLTFPIEGQLILAPWPAFGIGIDFLYSFNSQKNFYGFSLTLQVGRIRSE